MNVSTPEARGFKGGAIPSSLYVPPRRLTVLVTLCLVPLAWLGGATATQSRSIALVLFVSLAFSMYWLLPRHSPLLTTPRPFRWIPCAWVVLFFASGIKSSAERSTVAATTGQVNSDYVLELSAYGVVGLVAVGVWFHRRPQRASRSGWPLVLWPAFAVMSAAWSPVGFFTLVRSAQLVVVVALGLLCLRVASSDFSFGRSMTKDTLRLFLIVTSLFCLWGLIDRSAWANERFMWPMGQHPITVGMVIGTALLVTVFGGRTLVSFPYWLNVPLVGLFSLTVVLGQNRSVLIATIVGVLVHLWTIRDARRAWARYVALPGLLCAGLVVAVAFGQVIGGYLARGQSARALETLTGRTGLWEAAIGQLKTSTEWLIGFGYGSPRVILIAIFDWAGQSHSSIIEILLGLGLIGTTAAIYSAVAVGRRVLPASTNRIGPRSVPSVEAAVFGLLVTLGLVEAVLVLPGFGFSMWVFIFVVASVRSEPDVLIWSAGPPPDQRKIHVAA